MEKGRDKKGDAFVRKAFQEAVSKNNEADTALFSFEELFEKTLGLFCERYEGERLDHFVAQTNDHVCRAAIKILAETFFLVGFRNGVAYEKKKRMMKK